MVRHNLHVNGRFLTQGITGTQRYALELLRSLVSIKSLDITLHVPHGFEIPKEFTGVKIVRSRLKGFLFDQIHMAFASNRGLLLSLSGPITLLKKMQLGTIHDVGFVDYRENYSRIFVVWYWFMYRVATSRVQTIVTVSNFSKKEIERVFPNSKAEIVVVPGSGNHAANWKPLEPPLVPAELDFLLMVGTLSRRKNISSALGFLLESGFNVVICGSKGSKAVFASSDWERSSKESDAARVTFVEATDSELSWLYKNCRAFVFPSLYEGFGIPPLEARICGARVIASSASAIPEVLGDMAEYFNPNNFEGLLDALQREVPPQKLSPEKGWTDQSWEMSAMKLFERIEKMGHKNS